MDTITQEQKTLEDLCRAAGAGGLPEAAKTAAKLLEPYMDEVTLSPIGNVVGWRRRKEKRGQIRRRLRR